MWYYKGPDRSKSMESVLSATEITLTNSYWPTTDKRKLNDYQRKAIELAWNSKLSMIQGPPGIYFPVCVHVM